MARLPAERHKRCFTDGIYTGLKSLSTSSKMMKGQLMMPAMVSEVVCTIWVLTLTIRGHGILVYARKRTISGLQRVHYRCRGMMFITAIRLAGTRTAMAILRRIRRL
jgi:hypothetical protein